jgi:hypothetical protein
MVFFEAEGASAPTNTIHVAGAKALCCAPSNGGRPFPDPHPRDADANIGCRVASARRRV